MNAALLIDADNVSTERAIDEAIAKISKEGALAIRRAYGGHEKLSALRECLLRHGIRALVNHGKGTTDALLVLDAMDLLYGGALPQLIGIVSSDADFAPLAIRLRESGRRVICFAQEKKSSDDGLTRCYDKVVYLADGSSQGRPSATSIPKATAKKAAAMVVDDDNVLNALATIPNFSEGAEVAINEVVKCLRDAKVLGKNASGPKYLAKHADKFELIPRSKPTRVRLINARDA